MKFEDRIKAVINTDGNMAFMKSVTGTRPDDSRYYAWLLTFGLLETYITLKKVDLNDETY